MQADMVLEKERTALHLELQTAEREKATEPGLGS